LADIGYLSKVLATFPNLVE